ncbi:MAG: CarD family transcriptional regulator, partial [Bacillota bacterium]
MNFKQFFDLEKIGGTLGEIKRAINKDKSSVVFYAAENARYHISSNFDRFFLYVVSDRLAARRAKNIISAYIGEEIPIIFERDDVLINNHSVSSYSLGERLKALADIVQKKVKGAIISAEGLMQYYPKKELFEKSIKTFHKGQSINLQEFFLYLSSIGYKRMERMDERGSFSARGDVINIYTYDNELPYRIELFDDEIEKIKNYDPENLKTTNHLEKITIFPASDILVDQKSVNGILKSIEVARRNAKLKLSEQLMDIKSRFESFPNNPSLTWLLPFLKDNLNDIFEYIDSNALVVFDDLRSIDDKLKLLYNSHLTRVKSFVEGGQATRQHAKIVLSPSEIYDLATKYTKLGFSGITSSNPIFAPQEIFNVKSQSVPKYFNNFSQLVEDIKSYTSNEAKVFVYCKAYNIDSFIGNLKDNFIGAKKFEYGDTEGDVNVIQGNIPSGFVYNADKLVVLGNDDIERKRQTSSRPRKARDFVLPQKGDYVVHEKHGIGLSEGMQTIKTSDGQKDFYVVLYKQGDKLYLPAGQLDSLEKYSGSENPTLHRLGGAEFEKVKTRAKNSIKKMTIDLMKLYERRSKLKGHKYQPDTPWQKEMEDSFEFEETQDQIIATNEIKEDMESGKIMDRLLCGDVGYGKTEVAIRAIFKTVIEGKQAAILAPTTILAQQHFNTVMARLNAYKLKA